MRDNLEPGTSSFVIRSLFRHSSFVIALLLAFAVSPRAQTHDLLDLVLPSDNDGLFSGGGPTFYQYVERTYKGVKSTPWEGGQYGFVRDPIETPGGMVFTRFHEGIDIRCVHRDEQDEPIDEVRAIADGKVVHTNPVPGFSNYGKYVVIEHQWDGCNYYSLYAHLSKIAVGPGQQVTRGQRIGTMGHTGNGIDRPRAHLHLELNLMLSHRFESWYDTYFKREPNRNGIYNGINLAGLDIARLYLQLRKNPALTIPEFLSSEETFFKVRFPRSKYFELPRMYPWMVAASIAVARAQAFDTNASTTNPESWDVSFTQAGLPIRIEPSEAKTNEPELVFVKESPIDYRYQTMNHIAGTGKNAHLTDTGRYLMRLLIFPD
jgi:murein DD-endopeptidase MepM/ murein hydrolase activator NlpD